MPTDALTPQIAARPAAVPKRIKTAAHSGVLWTMGAMMATMSIPSWGQQTRDPTDLYQRVGGPGVQTLTAEQLQAREAAAEARGIKQAERAAQEKYMAEIKSLKDEIITLKRARDELTRQQANPVEQERVQQLQPQRYITEPSTNKESRQIATTQATTVIADLTKLQSTPEGPVFVALPLGEFELTGYKVQVSQRIAMSEKEITTAQYMACVKEGACKQPEWNETGSNYNLSTGSDNYYATFVGQEQPVVGVNWENAREYARWLTKKTGHSYRLPTEAEWEYACLAGQKTEYCGGNDADKVGWHFDNSGRVSHKGGEQSRNKWDLYDMSGNVWEWVADCYADDEPAKRKGSGGWAAHQTSAEKSNCSRVLRGGSWYGNSSGMRAANRVNYSPDIRGSYDGFRVVRTLP